MRWIPYFVVSLLLAASVSAQTVTYYGQGSPGLSSSLLVKGTPRLGATIEITTDQSLSGWANQYGRSDFTGTLLFGLDRIQARLPYGTQWINILTTPLLTMRMPKKTSTGNNWTYQTSFKVTIPNSTVFLGSKTMVQWYYVSSSLIYSCQGCGSTNLFTSRAAEILVGR